MVATGDKENLAIIQNELQSLALPNEYCINAIAKEPTRGNFIGSGIIAIAEEKLGQLWVGIEQSIDYISSAVRDISRLREIIDVPVPPELHKMINPSASNGKRVS